MTPEQIAAAQTAQERLAGTIPGAVVDALLPKSQTIGGLPVHPLTLTDFILLKKVDSPVVQPGKCVADCDDMDVLRLCYLVTHEPAESDELISSGMEEFDAAAMEFGTRCRFSDLREIGATVGRLLFEAGSTYIPTVAPGEPGKKKSSRKIRGTASPGL